MSCKPRVYKGDTITISIPFDVEGYSNLLVSYYTSGDYKITKTQDELTIVDGFIVYTFEGSELDLLPDGVIYYSLSYQVDGEPYVESTNTPLYLKTPDDYDAITPDEIWQSGYTAGLEDCSGGTSDCSSAITQAYQEGYEQGLQDCSGETPDCSAAWQDGYSSGTTDGYAEGEVVGKAAGYTSGYTDGYNQGQAECSGDTPCDCSEEIAQARNEGYESGYEDGYEEGQDDCPRVQYERNYTASTIQGTIHPSSASYSGMRRVNFDATPVFNMGHQSGYTDGYSAGLQDCSGDTPCDCSEEVAEAFQSGYTAGASQRCNLYSTQYITTDADTGHLTITPDPQFGEGFSFVGVNMDGFGNKMFQSGYSAGLADCPSCDCTSAITEAYGEGYESGRTDGFSSGYSAGQADCPSCDCSSAITEAYSSGWTDGYSSGVSACSCVLETKTVELTAITQTIQAGNNTRPVAPSGQTVYGGSIEEFENYIQHGNGEWPACYPHLYYYEDVNHTTEIEIGTFLLDTVQWQGYLFWDGVNTVYFNEMPKDEWVSACGGNLHFLNDGVNIWFYGDYKYGMTIRDNSYYTQLDINDLLFETVLYDGISAVTVDASAIYSSGYSQGISVGGNYCSIEVVFQIEGSFLANLPTYDSQGLRAVMEDETNTYVGTYWYNYGDYATHIRQEFDANKNYVKFQFVGHFENPAYPSPEGRYMATLGIDVLNVNLNSWGNWKPVYARFNGQPIMSGNTLQGIGSGGYLMMPVSFSTASATLTNFTHVLLYFPCE